MPLHDWTNAGGWEGLHHYWLASLGRQLRQRLPAGYRAYIGSGPAVVIGSPPVKPDLAVREYEDPPGSPVAAGMAAGHGEVGEPDIEVVAVATLEPIPTLFVERERRLVAAVEIISPRNKDRPSSRDAYGRRYAGYLLDGTHLMLVDLLPRPAGFSFAEVVESELGVPGRTRLVPPFAATYRVGEPVPGEGRFLAIWRRALAARQRLPTMPLPLTVHDSVPIDLESAYAEAAADTYMA